MTPGNSPSRVGDLDALVQLSELMLARGKAGEWDGMDSLVTQRLTLLHAVLEPQVLPTEAAQVAERLQRILTLDNELVALATAARDESAAQFRRLRNGKSANAAYDFVDRT